MNPLTAEEKQRIYLEEKARLDARVELEKGRITFGKVIGYGSLGVFGLFVGIWLLGSVAMSLESPANAARRKARTCFEAAQFNSIRKGYTNDVGQLAAALHCKAELKELEQYEPKKTPYVTHGPR